MGKTLTIISTKGRNLLGATAPTNTWNLWHQPHIDKFFGRLIESLIILENVDSNRVYVMGYSAGSDGVYQIGPQEQ